MVCMVVVHVVAMLLCCCYFVGDPDGVYGCGAGKLAETGARSVRMRMTHLNITCLKAHS